MFDIFDKIVLNRQFVPLESEMSMVLLGKFGERESYSESERRYAHLFLQHEFNMNILETIYQKYFN